MRLFIILTLILTSSCSMVASRNRGPASIKTGLIGKAKAYKKCIAYLPHKKEFEKVEGFFQSYENSNAQIKHICISKSNLNNISVSFYNGHQDLNSKPFKKLKVTKVADSNKEKSKSKKDNMSLTLENGETLTLNGYSQEHSGKMHYMDKTHYFHMFPVEVTQ